MTPGQLAEQMTSGIPFAEEMQEKAVNMNNLQIQLLQKIEELTLYIIQQKERIKELETLINKLLL